MKISVIVPVYNGGETISRCLQALLGQDYPADNYEIIVVNDGSEDDTKEIVEKYPVRLINLEKNYGRIVAREKGAVTAGYEYLLFVDARVIVAEDILKKIVQINYYPLMAGELGEDKYRSPFDTLFFLVRKKIYSPYYPQNNWGRELWIDRENFERAPKGFTCFFCSRPLFLEATPQLKNKMVNDDTRLLRSIIEKKKILRHTDLRITYFQRAEWKTVLEHIYERGPRFADYYLSGPNRYYYLWRGGLMVLFVLSGLCVYSPGFIIYALWGLAVVLSGIGLFLSDNVKDFAVVTIYSPVIFLVFIAGIIKGKLFSKEL